MLKKHKFIFKELPTDKVEEDPNQPRTGFGVNGDGNKLLLSIDQYGIEDPIKVSEIEPGRYIIIDGHRRYRCAKKLKWETVPCRVYPKMEPGEFESRRYEIQNNRRPWRPLERAVSFKHLKQLMDFKTNRELADHLHVGATVVSTSLKLESIKQPYLYLMAQYDLGESYQKEFVRLKTKLRKIRGIEVDEIIEVVFKKVERHIITNSKEFRKLGRVFLRATANEKELYEFLKNPDMTVSELEQKTIQSGFSLFLEKVIEEAAKKKSNGIAYSSQEKILIKQMRSLFKGVR